jgi:hypothetical protein
MRDHSPIWIGLADLLLCVVCVVIVAVAPTKAKVDGVKEKAEYLITADWSVSKDDDVDLWVQTPRGKPVFYGSRDVGCAKLDADNRGFMDGHVVLADGSETTVESNKETVSLRCIEPGAYDVAINLYASHEALGAGEQTDLGLKVRVEVCAVNPELKLVFAKDITLDRVKQTENVESFDLDREGRITLRAPPLENVTDSYYHHSSSAYTPGTTP